ncbi:MAG: Permease [Bryobacterales bacterium]|nr:Permease [Bryobacterales bacterium]
MEVSLSGKRYQRSTEVDRFARQLVARLKSLPGVESAAVASALPLFGRMDMIFDVPGRSNEGGRRFTGDVQWRFVTPAYFQTLRMPIVGGRAMGEHEPRNVVVVSQAMARRFWPGANPIGQSIVIGAGLGPGFEAGPAEIVGITGDVRERLNSANGDPVMYLDPARIPDRAMALMNRLDSAGVLVRARPGVPLASLVQPMHEALRAGDQRAASRVRTLDQARWDSTPEHRFNMLMFGAFALLGTFLAAVGIYGVTAYGVEQRRREIGIRTALGATRNDLIRWLLREALVMAGSGMMLGIVASLGLTQLIRSLLFGVTPIDAVTFTIAPLFTLAVALAAAGIPAIRASRTDPVAALRIG